MNGYKKNEKRAYRLYKQFKTTTREYAELADKLNRSVSDLNSMFSRMTHAK